MVRRRFARAVAAVVPLTLMLALLGVPADAAPSDTHSIGNFVWGDYGSFGSGNGRFNTGTEQAEGELGIDGVLVELLSPSGQVIAVQTTHDFGQYRFDGLEAGTYRVRLAARNFAAGGPLQGKQSSTSVASNDMGRTGNLIDHGLDDGTDPVAVGITSAPVTLGPADPFGDVASGYGDAQPGPNGDGHDNLVVDFGVVPSPPPTPPIPHVDWDVDFVDAAPGPHAGGSTVELRTTLRQLGPADDLQDTPHVVIYYPFTWTFLAEEDDDPCFGPPVESQQRLDFATGPCGSGGADPVGAAGYTFTFSVRFRVDPTGSDTSLLAQLFTDVDERSTTNNRVDVLIPAFPPVNATVEVGDRVWADDDGDGVQDPGEVGVSGARVELLDAQSRPAVDAKGRPVPQRLTGTNGSYRFTGLAAGQYRLRVRRSASSTAAPLGYWFMKGQQADASLDSDVGPTGVSPVFDLSPTSPHVVPYGRPFPQGYLDSTVDAGLQPLFALGNRVWLDADADGRQDSGEASLAGAQIRLTTADGKPARHADGTLVAPVRTAANGYYIITGLLPGSYVVTIVDIKLCSSATPPSCSVVAPNAGRYVFSPFRAAGATSATNSDVGPDGVSKPVRLAVGAPDVVRSDTNALNARWKNSTVDAGVVLR